MAKTPKKRKLEDEIETRPDAWERFKRQMHKIVPPKKPKRKSRKSEAGKSR